MHLASNEQIQDGWLMRWLQLTETARRRLAERPPYSTAKAETYMQVQELKDFAQRNTPPYGDMLTPLLAGAQKGKRVVILANGPSAANYKRKKGDVVIACNNALALCPDAQYWLVQEGGAHIYDWFWQHTGYDGQVVWERHVGDCAERLLAEYGEQFLSRVCWSIRLNLTPNWRLRSYLLPSGKQGGLVQDEVEVTPGYYEPVGTVLMQAIHLAGILGAESVDIWGAEFYFPGGKQHADGWAPFTANDGPTGVIGFELIDGEAVPVEHGAYQTTRQFFYSAAAVRDLLALIGADMPVTDHSAGLLNPAAMGKHPKDRAEPGQPSGVSVGEI